MAYKGPSGAELEGDIQYIKTPEAHPSAFGPGGDCGVPASKVSFDGTVFSSQLNFAQIIHSHLQSMMPLCQLMVLEVKASLTSS